MVNICTGISRDAKIEGCIHSRAESRSMLPCSCCMSIAITQYDHENTIVPSQSRVSQVECYCPICSDSVPWSELLLHLRRWTHHICFDPITHIALHIIPTQLTATCHSAASSSHAFSTHTSRLARQAISAPICQRRLTAHLGQLHTATRVRLRISTPSTASPTSRSSSTHYTTNNVFPNPSSSHSSRAFQTTKPSCSRCSNMRACMRTSELSSRSICAWLRFG